MRLYEGTIGEFAKAVLHNEIADDLSHNFECYYKRRPSPGEYRAWQQSFNFLRNSFESAGLMENQLVIEYELPYCA